MDAQIAVLAMDGIDDLPEGAPMALTTRASLLTAAILLIMAGLCRATVIRITYQGQLQQSGAPVNGSCGFEFRLFDAYEGGAQLTATFSEGIAVSNGLFTAPIDLDSVFFDGSDRYLQVGVRCPSGTGSFTVLSPRQQVTFAPYSAYAPSAGVAANVSCDGCIHTTDIAPGSVTGSTLAVGAVTAAALAAGSVEMSALAFTPGTVQSITAGAGLTGGTITASGTIGVNFGTTAGTVAAGNHTHDASYWNLGGNSGTNPAAQFVGTSDNQALELRVNGERALRLEPADGPNFIGGYAGNTVTSGVVGATISGGGSTGNANRVTDHEGTVSGGEDNQAGNAAGAVNDANFATVAGGAGNTAGGWGDSVGGGANNHSSGYFSVISGGYTNSVTNVYAAVGGGEHNTASARDATVGGGFGNTAAAPFATIGGGGRTDENNPATGNLVTDDYGTIGGGGDNQAGNENMSTTDAVGATVGGGGANSATNAHATVGGGFLNLASGGQSTVGGGTTNIASGNLATVPGGFFNSAEGTGSFAAGVNAHAAHSGSFVWSDGTASEASVAANQFVARAIGGFILRYGTGVNDTCILKDAMGFKCGLAVSDRNAKANFAAVEGRDVLAQLMRVPLQTWNYKSEPPAVRHLGPMAQDFHAAFNVGEDDTHIDTVDAAGVALAAIQGLYRLLEEKDAEIAALRRQTHAVEARLGQLEEAWEQRPLAQACSH